uniref:Uncharacterized protein n=1 Tax=Anguilla anguilla TaxID=7936 RepID=A0A0E9T8U2_ANGAN
MTHRASVEEKVAYATPNGLI